jgi:hypothetical protein
MPPLQSKPSPPATELARSAPGAAGGPVSKGASDYRACDRRIPMLHRKTGRLAKTFMGTSFVAVQWNRRHPPWLFC